MTAIARAAALAVLAGLAGLPSPAFAADAATAGWPAEPPGSRPGGKAGASEPLCPPFPEVAWWGKLSHEKTTRYVESELRGDWRAYIAGWERRQEEARAAMETNRPLVFPDSGVKLKGDALRVYVDRIGERIAVGRCLAGRSGEAAAAEAPRPRRRGS
jgi:hypothetical protein